MEANSDPHRALCAYLDSIAPWFPGGVPEATSVAGSAEPAPHSDVTLVFIAPHWSANPWEGSVGTLLQGLVEKGLKCAPAAVRHLAVGEGTTDAAAQLARIRPRAALVFGDDASKRLLGTTVAAARGRWHELSGVKLLVTVAPDLVVADAARKRELWDDVKPLIPYLSKEVLP